MVQMSKCNNSHFCGAFFPIPKINVARFFGISTFDCFFRCRIYEMPGTAEHTAGDIQLHLCFLVAIFPWLFFFVQHTGCRCIVHPEICWMYVFSFIFQNHTNTHNTRFMANVSGRTDDHAVCSIYLLVPNQYF